MVHVCMYVCYMLMSASDRPVEPANDADANLC